MCFLNIHEMALQLKLKQPQQHSHRQTFLHILPFHAALRGGGGRGRQGRGGDCTYCERKPAPATAGKEDAPCLPLCSLQLIDAGSLLPFSLPAQCRARLCHWELQQSPACCWAPRAAQRRLATFTPSLSPTKLHKSRRESPLKRTDKMATGGSQISVSVRSGFTSHF